MPECDPDRLIREQFIDLTHALEVDAKGITLGTHRAQTFSVKRFPDRIAFGMAARYIGDVVSGTRGIRHNVRITLSGVSSSIRSPRRASTDVSYPGPTASSSSPTW